MRRIHRGDVRSYPADAGDERRLVVVLARNGAIPFLRGIMVAPVTTVIRGLPSEVTLDKDFGLEARAAVNLDAVMTVSRFRLGEAVGRLGDEELDTISAKRITWDYQTVDGTAEADSDYGGRTGTLTFEPGDTRRTVRVEIVDDTMDEVDEDFRLRLSNPREPTWPAVEATAVIVDDDDNAIVADAWISRFGRTVATQVVDAVGGRFAGMGGPGSHFLLGADPFYSMLGPAGTRGYRRWEPRWGENPSGSPGSASLGLDAGQLLSGTSFVVRSQEEQEPYEGGFDGRWTAWGRGSFLDFDGLDPGVGLTGEVFNVTAGFDYESGALIAGLALAGSVGTGHYHVGRTDIQSERMGSIWSILGSVHPYVQVSLTEWLRIWGLGGIGSGTLRISGSEQDADLHMKVWAVGGRSDLRAPVAGLGLALKSDVFWVEMESDAPMTGAAPSRSPAGCG